MPSIQRYAVLALLLFLSTTVTTAQDADLQAEREKAARARLLEDIFRLPSSVKLTDEQKEKLTALKVKKGAEFVDRVRSAQQKLISAYTAEQQQTRRRVFREAREAKKSRREFQLELAKALKLTDEQKQQIEKLQREHQRAQVAVRREIMETVGIQRRRGNRPRQPRIPPTQANVKYGPHERNVLDFWQAKSDKPTPVLVSIHGGGFRAGNKSVAGPLLQQCLDAGISVVAITYRFSQHAIAPAPFTDSARAIQFVRHNAKEWNIDPKRMAATGGSAGAGISLWLGFHDDMADPDNDDAVLRQSTRLTCMFVSNGQTSYDPRFIRDLFPGTDTYKHSALAQLYDVDLDQLDDLPKEKYDLFEETSAIPHLSKDDPPAILVYSRPLDAEVTNQGIGIHHAKFGKALKDRMDKLGIPCEVHAAGRNIADEPVTSSIDFMKRHFKLEK